MATSRKSTTDDKTDRELAKVQRADADQEALKAVSDGPDPEIEDSGEDSPEEEEKQYDTVELKDRKFRLRDRIPALAGLKWSAAAELDTNDTAGQAAIYSMLKAIMIKEDWPAFENYAMNEADADFEELLDVIIKALEVFAGRPTKRS